MRTDRCVALLQGKSKKVKGKKFVGVLHLRHHSQIKAKVETQKGKLGFTFCFVDDVYKYARHC